MALGVWQTHGCGLSVPQQCRAVHNNEPRVWGLRVKRTKERAKNMWTETEDLVTGNWQLVTHGLAASCALTSVGR